jgi:predicted glutamine amidotransferase
MCRWLAYSGSPIRLEELLVKRDRSLIDQSLHSRQGATPTNGDGFGVGWYEAGEGPRVYRSTHPAWNDRNLRELAAGISSPLFFAHIRASTGTAIQETNTHPFRYANRLWMHNGLIRDFHLVKRELQSAVDDAYFGSIEGTTDSETMVYLALTFGLEDDPVAGVERMVGFVEETGRAHGIEHPIQMTVATTTGRRSGRSATRASTIRARCTSAPAWMRSRLSIRRARSSRGSPTRRAWSSRSRSETYQAPGRRCPSRTSASCSPATTSSGRSVRSTEAI